MRCNTVARLTLVALLFSLNSCKKNNLPVISYPGISLTTPTDGANIGIDSLNFLWSGTSGQTYLIQIMDQLDNPVVSTYIDSSKYHSSLEVSCYSSCSPNYILGSTYHWLVMTLGQHSVTSATHSFTIKDPRGNFEGQWNGRFHSSSWIAGVSKDTTYNGFVNIASNGDGSISVGEGGQGYGSAFELFAYSNIYYAFGTIQGFGTHEGASCTFDNTFHHLIYVSGGGGMAGGGIDSFFASR
jgi:hypothetical protein